MTVEEACIVLGIKKENMDRESLKRAYHEAARLCHPDANPENSNAASKFTMIEEAYRVLQVHVRFESLNQSSRERRGRSQYEKKDPWESYNEADRRFHEQRQNEARRKMEEAMRRQREAEKRKRQYEEALQRQREAERRKEQEKETAKRQRESAGSRQFDQARRSAESVGANRGSMAASFAAKSAPDLTIPVPDKAVWIKRGKAIWDGFLSNSILYDVILVGLVFVMMITELLYRNDYQTGHMGFRYLLMWSFGILFARKFAVFSKKAPWANRIVQAIFFLVALELQIVVFKLLYI